MKLKNYTIGTKNIKEEKLHAEIFDSGAVVNFQGISKANGVIEIIGDSFANETLLDSIYASHEDLDLSEYKDIKSKEIDSRTQELISNGFPYDGATFSLSSHAQLNWIGMKTADIQDLLTFPMGITTIDDDEYSIQNKSSLTTFYVTGLVYKKSILDSGRNLKVAVKAATTKAEIDLVLDNRWKNTFGIYLYQ